VENNNLRFSFAVFLAIFMPATTEMIMGQSLYSADPRCRKISQVMCGFHQMNKCPVLFC